MKRNGIPYRIDSAGRYEKLEQRKTVTEPECAVNLHDNVLDLP